MAKQVSPGVLALRKVVDDVHKEAREAKARGELVGWSSSKFPCELAAAFDLHVMYPENQAAGIAANRYGELMCQAAEDLGYDNDICGYARISLAYAAGVRVSRKYDPETGEYIIDPSTGKPLKDADGNVVMGEDGKPKKDPKTQTPYLQLDNLLEIEKLPDGPEKEKRLEAISPIRQMRIPQPDFVLCCNNICNCMIKWYENLAKELNIPMFMIDIPFNPDYEVSDAETEYIKAQFWDVIHGLEAYTGKKWSDERFKEVMASSGRASRAWIEATSQAKYVPSPFNGFDLLNHMAVMVTARGKEEAGDAMETLLKEYKENHEKGVSTFRAEEKYRIMFEGIACWPWLRVTSTGLKSRGINMVTTIYADAFGFIYDDFDGMCRAYANVPNAMNLEHSRDKRIKLCKDNHVEGLLVHTNRSCKLWSGFMPEMSRQIGEACGIPVVSFDGDQADPRNFSEAQYDTRVQGLTEIMEANKGGK